MKKKDWGKYFPSTILSRGLDYYKAGLVYDTEFNEDNNELCASVSGTEEYSVSICFDDSCENISEMYCDCPYAESGYNCKHMAALLYAFDEGLKTESLKPTVKMKSVSIENIIDSLSESDAKKYLLEAALKSKNVSDKLILNSSNADILCDEEKHWKKKIRKIIYDAGGEYDYIDYDEAYDMFEDIVDYLDERLDILIKKELYDVAFDLICFAYEELQLCEFDDSDGGYSDFLSLFTDTLNIIIDSSGIIFKRKIFKWVSDNDLDSFFFDSFEEKEFLESNLRMIESKINACSDSDGWMLSDLVEKKCFVLKKLNTTEIKILSFRNKYRYLYEIRKHDAEEYLKNGDYEEVERLAIESKSIDNNSYYLSAWSEKLINIYKSTGQTEKYKSELLYYIFELDHFNLDIIKELKKLVLKGEWLNIRNQLIESPKFYDKCEFLCYEKLYTELLDNIIKHNTSSLFVTYEKELVKNLPVEARDAFLKILDKEMERANQRSWYSGLASKLSRIRKKYPDGKAYADNMAKKWAASYKRRSAMLEELRYAGFDV